MRIQRGGFSPFMFGLLAGVAIFSASIRGHLQNELQRAEEAKLERTRQETQALARAVESAIMTETSATYAADVTLNRILPYADGTTGRTAGGSGAQINTFQTGPMGRVMVGLTDDGYVRNELATAVGDLTQSPLGARSDIAIVDIAALRTRQMELSLKNLDQEAGLLYYFWNRQNRFPTDQAEYKAQVNSVSGLRDFWGQDFTYTAVDANNGGLAFIAPWGEARSISVTMASTTSSSAPPTASCTSVGQAAEGGRCATTGANALIAASSDAPITLGWGSDGILRSTNSADGYVNTQTLASFGSGAHPAAHYCWNLVQNGYDDWYLPAMSELSLLYTNRAEIGGFDSGSGYWSSNEGIFSFLAWVLQWWNGFPIQLSKEWPGVKVRCVRKAN